MAQTHHGVSPIGRRIKSYEIASVLGEREPLDIVLPILDGLTDVHTRDVLHRHAKPGRICLRRSGPPVLFAFGAALLGLRPALFASR